MSLNSRKEILARLERGKDARFRFVESHLNKTMAAQIRATRDRLGWSQERLAAESGMTQNAISRLESLHYGKATITTLKRLAKALDVGLVVRFAPFSELLDWVTATPHISAGLSREGLAVPSYEEELRLGSIAMSKIGSVKETCASLSHWNDAQGPTEQGTHLGHAKIGSLRPQPQPPHTGASWIPSMRAQTQAPSSAATEKSI